MSDNRIFFDAEHLRQLRRDAELNNIDLSTRARIERSGEQFLVCLGEPLVDVVSVLGHAAPRTTLCLSAAEAEGTLLVQCLRVQRAERLKVRQGRTFGWSTDQIVRRPLTDDELSRFRAEQKHNRDRASLIEQLNEALAAQRQQAQHQVEVDRLAEHYVLEPAKPAVPTAHKADPATPIYPGRQAPTGRRGSRK